MFNSWWARDQGKARGWRHRKRERVIKDGKSQRQLYPDGGWWDWSLSFWWEGGILLRCHKDLSRMTCNALCILITHYELVMTHWRSKLWAEQVCILLVALLTCPGISASFYFFGHYECHQWFSPVSKAVQDCMSSMYLNTQGKKQESLLCPLLVQQKHSPCCDDVKYLKAPMTGEALNCLESKHFCYDASGRIPLHMPRL